MTISKSFSAIPSGLDARLITIECDSANSLPSLNIIGMANKTVDESRERIRSAIKNSGLNYPTTQKITINLAPAELPKTGSTLDLGIAAAILAHYKQFPPQTVAKSIFAGELALNGQIRPIRGILNIIECAKRNCFKYLFISTQNTSQAQLINPGKLKIIPVKNLAELWKFFVSPSIKPLEQTVVKNNNKDKNYPILDHIIGLEQAKRALIIAVAGHHNILLSGAPGAGKSMLASVIPNLLPDPTQNEIVELTKLHSLIDANTAPTRTRPFRAPHHSTTRTKIIGGADGLPGEISLAHRGVLFLDELPEYNRDVIEALRQPLENKSITLSHAHQKISYPSDFMLAATMNPCPCGYYGSNDEKCKCTPSAIERYRRKLSGPLLDRIDLRVVVPSTDTSVLLKNTTISTHEHASAKILIQNALNKQINRYGKYNSNLTSQETIALCSLATSVKSVLDNAAKKLGLSARSYFKTIKVARTIADLEDSETILSDHLREALLYRQEI